MATKDSKSQEVAEVKANKNALPVAAGVDFEADAAAVQETMGKDDIALPFISIAQGPSPQLLRSKPEYIEGLKVGDIFNSVTKERWDGLKGIIVVPSLYVRTFVEWVPRDNGGGFVADHGLEKGLELEQTTDDEGRLPNGNDLVETHYHFVLVQTEDGYKPGLMAMSSSGLKPSRQWNTLVSQVRVTRADGSKFQPARPFTAYLLQTVEQTNDQGTWQNWKITAAGRTVDQPDGVEAYKEAIVFAKQMLESGYKPSPPAEAAAASTETADSANY